MKQQESEYSVASGWPFIIALAIFVLLSCANECNAQYIFNSYSVTNHVDIEYVKDSTQIDIKNGTVLVINSDYDFEDKIIKYEYVSNSKRILYTESQDQFILVGFKDLYQIKWVLRDGSIVTFFNTNKNEPKNN